MSNNHVLLRLFENVHPAEPCGTKSRGMRRAQKVYGIRFEV